MSKAILRGIRLSPKKSRLIARQIQGMNGEYALATLEFTPNKAAKIIYKVLASAIANGDFQPEEVIITSCRIDEGPVLKRFRPRARGSASKIRKPTAHILVEVDKAKKEVEQKATKVAKPKVTKTTAKKEVVKKEVVKKEVTPKVETKTVKPKVETKTTKTPAKATASKTKKEEQ
jgi:large subunit ribosomal protein L22